MLAGPLIDKFSHQSAGLKEFDSLVDMCFVGKYGEMQRASMIANLCS